MRKRALVASLVGPLVLAGCASLRTTVPVKPPPGFLFEAFSAPAEANFENAPVGSKQGEATTHVVQDPILTGPSVSWGDASIQTVAENVGISKVHYLDYEFLSVLGIYVQLTVKISGD